jgi:hypothetical protein
MEMVDEMRSIRYIERANGAKVTTPSAGAQLDICREFGFEIPDGCAPVHTPRAYASRKKLKRGPPPKKMVEQDL